MLRFKCRTCFARFPAVAGMTCRSELCLSLQTTLELCSNRVQGQPCLAHSKGGNAEHHGCGNCAAQEPQSCAGVLEAHLVCAKGWENRTPRVTNDRPPIQQSNKLEGSNGWSNVHCCPDPKMSATPGTRIATKACRPNIRECNTLKAKLCQVLA